MNASPLSIYASPTFWKGIPLAGNAIPIGVKAIGIFRNQTFFAEIADQMRLVTFNQCFIT